MPEPGFRKFINEIASRKSAAVTVFADFCRMSACALAAGSREEEYLEVARRYTRDELSDISQAFAHLVQEMERHPFADLLGPFYIECAAHSSKQARGEFYTPPEISKLMARVLFDVEAAKLKKEPITLNEPACGSGGMVLAVAELFAPDAVDLLRVTAQDINPVAADMAYINLTLWGIPARVILGDTISKSATREWMNVHWFRVGENSRRLAQRFMEVAEEIEAPTSTVDLGQIRESLELKSQLTFDF
ncbi:MAG: N-6 DNA methylase [Luteolibacter sp.]|uniref:N-6 DNA methylase n=1 Tax=Luteolibacter sp. TaxID=1962973 RepID=UPI003267868C